ncbi:type VI secretion system protein ImpA [Roseomonas alkaliterrae]|uniref:Type VI secretion system protein ImpA n=2 Tax=Neoroseomonas alkaliterrae TaxID=1452450 RepID=A0A840XVG2_9PROT|nr:type VI secretion system protein TssA [Neoroseomonas alkaliterrae]MBB5690629.1 type VI secretion system protein ImpA [Neoroseomonas alkaliterrae]
MGEGVIDLEALLAPLATGDGGGEDLRPDYSPTSLYQRIRTQRNDARAGERAMDGGDPEANPAAIATAWREVKKLGIEALSGKSKDFEIAAWMAEALVRVDGLAGLADAAELIAGLCNGFWETGFPRLDDEDGLDGRGAPLGGLSGEGADGTVMGPIRRYPLFLRPDGTECDLFTWQRAEETAAIADAERRNARLQSGIPDFDALQNEARAAVPSLRAAGAAASKALATWTAMDAAITARFGGDAPSTRRVSEALQAIIDISTRIAGAPAESAGAEEAQAGTDAPATAAAGGGGAAAPAPRAARTREDVIRQLEEIAEYFRKTEPHSPLAFTLQDAARRARMPLTDLLAEVLPDPSTRRQLLTTLGIHVPEGE